MNYHVARNGQQLGSLPESEIRSRLGSGDLSPNDLCWAEGMAEWKPLGAMLTPQASEAVAPPTYNPVAAAPAHNPYAAPRADLGRPQLGTSQLAGLGQRLAAVIVDSIIAMVAFSPFIVASAMMAPVNPEASADVPPDLPPAAVGLMIAGAVLLLILMIYSIVLLSTKGQTLGKKLLGIRITNLHDDGNPGFVKAVLLRIFVNSLLGIIPLYGLIDILFIFSSDRRCIHDKIAGTRVIQG